MVVKSLRTILFLLISIALASCGSYPASTQMQPLADEANRQINAANALIGPIYEQPVDPGGKIYLSAWIDPDGTDFDQKIWDNFTLQSNETITEIDWYGGYDPLKNGMGGPVLDFTVAIYPSIAAGTEPAVAGLPLVTYQTVGNAGEISFGTVGGIPMYAYTFNLPAPFSASAGVKYWVHIVASQGGSSPDWGLAAGTGGNSSHYRWGAGVGGDSGFRSVPGDAAFTLLGPVPDLPTPTDTPTSIFTDTPTNIPTDIPTDTATSTPSDTPTNTPNNPPIDTATSTPTDSPTNTATYTPTETATSIPVYTPTPTATNTSTNTATSTLVNTPTNTATDIPTPTATYTPTDTATNTPTNTAIPTASRTPTNTATSTPVNTATHTPTHTQISNIPGKVNGGGIINSTGGLKATFGFVVSYDAGNPAPQGNLVYHDRALGLRLNAALFNYLVIDGDHAWFTGTGTLNDGRTVTFKVVVDDLNKLGSVDSFHIDIPALNGYQAGGALSGGNITIH